MDEGFHVGVTVQELARLVGGQVHGDGEQVITGARAIHEAGPGDVTLVESEKYLRTLLDTPAAAAVVPDSLPVNGRTLIRVPDALTAFLAIFRQLHAPAPPYPPGIDIRSVIHPTATIGPDATVHPFVVIGEGTVIGARCQLHAGAVVGRNCRLGDDVILYPHAVLYDETILGNRVIVHANVVLGADGFGYRQQGGKHVRVPQYGRVEISDDVEIGACTTIDRGTFQATRVGPGTKIDNLVMIGHNCQIGPHNLLVSQVGIAGSSTTGAYVVMAGQVGVADHLQIGDGVVVGAKTGVASHLASGERYLGLPASPEHLTRRVWATARRLPEIYRDLKRIKDHLQLPDQP